MGCLFGKFCDVKIFLVLLLPCSGLPLLKAIPAYSALGPPGCSSPAQDSVLMLN